MKKLLAICLTMMLLVCTVIPASAESYQCPRDPSVVYHEAVDNTQGMKGMTPICLVGVEIDTESGPNFIIGLRPCYYRYLIVDNNPDSLLKGVHYLITIADNCPTDPFILLDECQVVDEVVAAGIVLSEHLNGRWTPVT